MEIMVIRYKPRRRVENALTSEASCSRTTEWLFFINGMAFVDLAFHRAI
jgi:hypothetical protein